MPAYLFEEIAAAARRRWGLEEEEGLATLINERQPRAMSWLRSQSRKATAEPSQLLTGDSDLTSKLLPGRMYLFRYDPKLRETLPYYDKYPLIFIVDIVPQGFSGINLHYLPPILRAELFDALYDLVEDEDKMDIRTSIQLSYQLLKSGSSSLYKPCYKRYLYGHVKSRFLWISPEHWDIAMMLPLARFQKASINTVWKHSRDKVR